VNLSLRPASTFSFISANDGDRRRWSSGSLLWDRRGRWRRWCCWPLYYHRFRLFWRRQLFDLLVKHSLHAFSLLGHDVLRSIEGHTVAENQSNIGNKLISADVTRVCWVGIRFNRVRSHQLALDGSEVHGMFDDLKVMRYLQSLRVDRKAERSGILQLFESSNCRQRKFVLRYTEIGRRQLAIYARG